jgi:hypothetical protein
MNVFDKHQLSIARKTLKMSVAGALIMGGMNHSEARLVIIKLTGKDPSGKPCDYFTEQSIEAHRR